jgi:hypothetical protein
MLARRRASRLEQAVVQVDRAGRLLDPSVGDAADDDPTHGVGWPARRQVRAELLAEFLTGDDRARLRGLWRRGARITGRLDLEAASLSCHWSCRTAGLSSQ